MLADLLAEKNRATFNSYIANKYGLELAIYVEQVISYYSEACRNETLQDGGVRLPREEITEHTTLSNEKQLDIDEQLESMRVLERHTGDVNVVMPNIHTLIVLFSDEDLKVVNMANKLKDAVSKNRKSKEKKEQNIERNLKTYITTDNEQLRQAYYTWIDSMVESNPTALNREGVLQAQQFIDEFVGNDLELALTIINCCAIYAYRCMEWGVKIAHDRLNIKSNLNKPVNSQIAYASPQTQNVTPKPIDYGVCF